MRIGIDLGGTKIAAGIVSNGKVVREVVLPTPRGGGAEAIGAQVREAIAQLSQGGRIERIGMGVPGITRGTRALDLSLAQLNGLDMRRLLRTRMPLALGNDADCFALGEHLYGTRRGSRVLVGVTLGTGLGSGVVIDGALFRGAHGNAPELGHLIYDVDARAATMRKCPGRWEGLLSGPALLARYRALGGKEAMPSAIWSSKEKAAKAVREDAARHLAIFCANIVRAYDPDAIVIGGGVASRWLVDAANARMPDYGCAKVLRLSALREKAAILGADALHG